MNLAIPLTLTTEIASRVEVNRIYTLMAVLLGFAAVLAFNRGTSEVIAGVTIDAQIIPPMAVMGIVLVIHPSSLIASSLLVGGQIIGLVVGALLAVAMLQVRPRSSHDQAIAQTYLKHSVTLIGLLCLPFYFGLP